MKSGASIIAESIERAVDYKLARSTKQRTKTVTGVFVGKDGEGKAWVRLSGAEGAIPVRRMSVQADVGDTVSVTVGGGRAVVDSNVSNPSASSTNVAHVDKRVTVAQSTAAKAINYAVEAAAASNVAKMSASNAQASAEKAFVAADNAEAQAARANTAAENAEADAQRASDAADDAMDEAVRAHGAADDAQASANSAKTAADTALTGLSIVEDVAGTLDWISKHGTYKPTTDTTVVEGRVYFEKQGNDYVPVVNPTGNPQSQGWYVLDVTDSQSDFIMAHLAVTGRGLWVLPSGMGSSTTPASGETQADSDARQGASYKMLLSSDGTYIYDGNGDVVIKYGQNIEPSNDRPFYIGDPNSTSYILFTPASGSTPASISIGGSVKIGTSKTLSELLADLDKSSLTVRIESSAGTSFRNGEGSTILTAKVFQYSDTELDASGTSFTYRWYLNGTQISGANSKTYTATAPSTTATYTCEVTI